MDSQSNVQSGGLNLPQPLTSNQPPQLQNVAQNVPPQNMAGSPLPMPQSMPQQATMPLPVPTAPVPLAPQAVASVTTQSGTPAFADDSDLIEKEWVLKAKRILAATANDPHQQSIELSILRADYMQKRYNKQLKISE